MISVHTFHGYRGNPQRMRDALAQVLTPIGHHEDYNQIAGILLPNHNADPRKISLSADISRIEQTISEDPNAIIYTNSYGALPAMLTKNTAKAYIFDQPLTDIAGSVKTLGKPTFVEGLATIAHLDSLEIGEQLYDEIKDITVDPKRFRQPKTPTFWISGEYDKLCTPPQVELAAQKAQGEYLCLPKGHNEQHADPADTAKAIRHFIIENRLY